MQLYDALAEVEVQQSSGAAEKLQVSEIANSPMKKGLVAPIKGGQGRDSIVGKVFGDSNVRLTYLLSSSWLPS